MFFYSRLKHIIVDLCYNRIQWAVCSTGYPSIVLLPVHQMRNSDSFLNYYNNWFMSRFTEVCYDFTQSKHALSIYLWPTLQKLVAYHTVKSPKLGSCKHRIWGGLEGLLRLFIAAYSEEGNGKLHSGWLVLQLMFKLSFTARLSCCTNDSQPFFSTDELLE
jgi:hypothetical protein